MSDNVKADRTEEDLLIQTMLQLGVLLSSKIAEEYIDEKHIFNVADGHLIACFDENVTIEVVEQIAARAPSYAVFRDSSFNDDATLANFDQVFERVSPKTERRII